jgi:hypothetical protein
MPRNAIGTVASRSGKLRRFLASTCSVWPISVAIAQKAALPITPSISIGSLLMDFSASSRTRGE